MARQVENSATSLAQKLKSMQSTDVLRPNLKSSVLQNSRASESALYPPVGEQVKQLNQELNTYGSLDNRKHTHNITSEPKTLRIAKKKSSVMVKSQTLDVHYQ